MAHTVDELNRIGNPRLSEGRANPRGWRWMATGQGQSWTREPASNGDAPLTTIRSSDANGRAGWSRRTRCKAGDHYRIEAIVSGDYERDDPGGGFVLSVEPFDPDESCGPRLELVGPARMSGPTILRAYYHAPDDTKSVEVSVALVRAKGQVCIHEVMMLPIIEPEAKSHVHAAPPPPYAQLPPRQVRSVCVCTGNRSGTTADSGRPIARLLEKYYGAAAVTTVAPSAFRPDKMAADAVMFVDESLPASVASIPKLYKLAESRLVVLSLPAFARIAGSATDVRTVVQPDDPIHAKVRWGSFATQGFAIGDVFPYAWRGSDRRTFVQRHFRKSPSLRAFCQRHGFETILESVCDSDATSERPICLYKEADGGGVVVLDIEPAESIATNFDEPDLALYVLLNFLGASQGSLGQYVAPARSEQEFRDEIVELGQRYRELEVCGQSNPDKPRGDQFVQLGCPPEDRTVPVVTRPAIVIRTGLRGDDTDGVYGTMLWLKQLVRPEPYVCPYAAELISHFRFLWVPLCSDWHAGLGWRCPDGSTIREGDWEFEPDTMAAAIDVTSTPLRRLRIVVSDEQTRAKCAAGLPQFLKLAVDRRFFYRSVPSGHSPDDRAAMEWCFQRLSGEVVLDGDGVFDSSFHRRAAEAGASLIRLELPGPQADLTTGSIWRTDLAAGALEHLVGSLYGCLAMNRQRKAVRVTPPADGLGDAGVILASDGPQVVTKPVTVEAGKAISLKPGAALCVQREQPSCARRRRRRTHASAR